MNYLAFLFLTLILFTNCNTHSKKEEPIQNPDQKDTIALPFSSDGNYILWSKGIDYHAFGENPDWIMEIDFENVAYLQLDGIKHLFQIDDLYIKQEENKVQYMAFSLDSGLLLEILDKTCEPYNPTAIRYQSRIQIMDKDGESIELIGCGNYIPNYRLNDIYALDSVPGFDLASVSFAKGIPYLELHVRELKFLGHDGCKNISGTFLNEIDRLEFGHFDTPETNCSIPMQFDFLTELAKVRSYEFDQNGLLFLDENDDLVLRLKKVD